MRFRWTAFILTAIVLPGFASPASAATFTAQVRNNDNGQNIFLPDSSAVDTKEVPFPSNFGVEKAFIGRAAAGPGILRVNAQARIQGLGPVSHSVNGGSRASATYDDVIATGPDGATSVEGRIRQDVSGIVLTDHHPGDSNAYAYFELQFVLPGGNVSRGDLVDDAGEVSAIGLLAGSTRFIHKQIASGTATFSMVGPNTVTISIAALASASWGGGEPGHFATADSLFENTVSFPSSGPVFDLPEGYTVNSVSANIVDNHWVGAVPEPATLTLLASAFLATGGIGFLRRRRHAT